MSEGARIRQVSDGTLMFKCPGCSTQHALKVSGPGAVWTWNGDVRSPTLSPSVLVRTGHYVEGHKGDTCWCTWSREHPDEPAPFICAVCHSFIVDGYIQFLDDCTHALVGQTVALPEFS